MIRTSLSNYLLAGCMSAALATPAAAQCNSCCTPTVAYSPVQVQAYQPVVVQQERSWCCLSWLCDWIWGRNHTTVAAVPTAVPQTYAYPPAVACPPVGCDPCSACGTSPCCCPSAGAVGGAPSTFAPAYAGYRGYEQGAYRTHPQYASAPVPQTTMRVANSIQGAVAVPNVVNGSHVQLMSYQVPAGSEQPAAYTVSATGRMSPSRPNMVWQAAAPVQTAVQHAPGR